VAHPFASNLILNLIFWVAGGPSIYLDTNFGIEFQGGPPFRLESDFEFDLQGAPSFAAFSKGWESSRVESIEL
jgi:hypothetical protein